MRRTEYKLTELAPRWLGFYGRTGMGLSFECPCCSGTNRCIRIAVWFSNPIDGGAPYSEAPRKWQREGDTFNTLTLQPSIDASGGSRPDWHGHITNGNMIGGVQNRALIPEVT